MDPETAIKAHAENAQERLAQQGFTNITAQPWMLPFHVQKWPQWVLELSPIPTLGFPLTIEERDALIGLIQEQRSLDDPQLLSIADKISALGFNKFFIRLGSRSPKDSFGILDTMCCQSGMQALLIMAQSERVYVDLQSYRTAGEEAWVVVREWRDDIEQLREYRCYIEAGELVGVSQYMYRSGEQPPVPIHQARDLINAFWLKRVRDLWAESFTDGVLDVWISGDRVHLLEINPPRASDPCLFEGGRFDRTIRYVNGSIPL